MLTSVIAIEFMSGTVLQECYVNGVHTCMQTDLASYGSICGRSGTRRPIDGACNLE